MRDLLRRDAVAPRLQQELYPEIAVIWGLVFSVFLQWEAERLQPQEIFIGVVVTIVGAFLTRMLAIALRLKGWAYGWYALRFSSSSSSSSSNPVTCGVGVVE